MAIKGSKKSNKVIQPHQRLSVSSLAHTVLNVVLPVAVLLLIRSGLTELAIGLVVLSKWRILAVQPRHWLANLRSNATDIIFNLAAISFIAESSTLTAQIVWTAIYVMWLTIIKPRSDTVSVAVQAMSGLLLGMSALLQYDDLNELIILLGVWFIAVSAARHFLSSYEEPFTRPLSYIWGFFVVQIAWVLYRWTLVYFIVPQLVLIVGVIGYTLASLYDQRQQESISGKIARQHLLMAAVIIIVIIAMADWTGEGLP